MDVERIPLVARFTCVFALYSSLEFGVGLRLLWRDPVGVSACLLLLFDSGFIGGDSMLLFSRDLHSHRRLSRTLFFFSFLFHSVIGC